MGCFAVGGEKEGKQRGDNERGGIEGPATEFK